MRTRIVTVVYALMLGAWFYSDQKQISLYSQGTYEFLHALAFELALAAAAVLVGFVVGRWWVILALIGPLLSLGYLQATGYVSPWHDGTSPLSLSTLVGLTWFALLLLLGAGGRSAWDRLHGARREASA